MAFILIFIILTFVFILRQSGYEEIIEQMTNTKTNIQGRLSGFSYSTIKDKVKELGKDYSSSQFYSQMLMAGGAAFAVTFVYFYSIPISAIYTIIAISMVPYISFLNYKRIYSEFIFEQVLVYVTNVIMEFQITASFIKAIEGVYSTNTLQDPVQSDLKKMLEISYKNGSIEESLEYFNERYDYYMVKNTHQIFLQVTNEGAHNAVEALDNMLTDIDGLVEAIYRDRMDRNNFYKKFLQFGVVLYFMAVLIQFILGAEMYTDMLKNPLVIIILNLIIIINSYFLLKGVRYYNENVGAE